MHNERVSRRSLTHCALHVPTCVLTTTVRHRGRLACTRSLQRRPGVSTPVTRYAAPCAAPSRLSGPWPCTTLRPTPDSSTTTGRRERTGPYGIVGQQQLLRRRGESKVEVNARAQRSSRSQVTFSRSLDDAGEALCDTFAEPPVKHTQPLLSTAQKALAPTHRTSILVVGPQHPGRAEASIRFIQPLCSTALPSLQGEVRIGAEGSCSAACRF